MKTEDFRYFVTYSGVSLPLKLVNELAANETANRNTYFRAAFDPEGRLSLCQKVVYNEVELEHRYSYCDSGQLSRAEIVMDGECSVIEYDKAGNRLA